MAKKPSWRAKAMYLVFALALVAGLVPLVAAPVSAGSAEVWIDGPDYWKQGEPVTFFGFYVSDPPGSPPDSATWSAGPDAVPPGETDPSLPDTFTTTFMSDGIKTVTLEATWGTITQTDTFTLEIGVGLLPQVAFNVIGVEEEFCVPQAYQADIDDWFVTKNLMPDGDVVVRPADPTYYDPCVSVQAFDWGNAFVQADLLVDPWNLLGEKKWGKIYETWLWGWDYWDYGNIEPTTNGSTQMVWNENNKEWEGGAYLEEWVIGHFRADPPAPFFLYGADGAVVDWWLLDARAPVHSLPTCGYAADLSGAVNTMQAQYPAKLVNFCQTGTDNLTTTSGDNMGGIPGLTTAGLCALGEESVKIVVLARYPFPTLYQEQVCLEIMSWNFWTQEVEKVPQVRWAGEKIVLEKEFGTNYVPNDVSFKLENQSVGTLEGVYPDDDPDDQNTVWTVVQDDGVARCILTSESPGECDVTVTLLDSSGWIINQHGFVVFFLKFEDIYLGEVAGVREDHDAGLWTPPNPYDPLTDDMVGVDTLNVSQDALIRARVKGWFMGDDLSVRDEVKVDLDGDGVLDTRLPDGRWVLPDDWPILAGADWQTRRPHWDIMDNPYDDVRSVIDSDLDKFEELGDYVTWGLAEIPPDSGFWWRSPVANDYAPGLPLNVVAAQFPVIGPYSSLDDYTPFVNGMVPTSLGLTENPPQYLYRKTIVRNLALDWWDCPMPPAKVAFEITGGPGFFKDMNKGWAYYEWELPYPGLFEELVYTNPFYYEEIPAHALIPPFINNGGYDWDSWGWTIPYGPYPFWEIINQPRAYDDPQHPTKVEVYSDNHGEAMVLLNGFWDVDLGFWATGGGFDVPLDEVVGTTVVKVTADYPYLRKHLYVSNPRAEDLIKDWTWGKSVVGAEPHQFTDGSWDFNPLGTYERMLLQTGTLCDIQLTDTKMAFIWVTDADGQPAIGERCDWTIEDIVGGTFIPNINATPPASFVSTTSLGDHLWVAVQNGILAGTSGTITDGVVRKHATSYTRLPTLDEIALFEKFQLAGIWPATLDPYDYAIAGVMVYSSATANFADLSVRIYEGPVIGPVFRHWEVDWSWLDPWDDAIVRGDANTDGNVNMGDVVRVERVILGLSLATSNADANENGAVDMGDVTKIERIILGI